MKEAIKSWLLALANRTVNTYDGSTGILRVYANRRKMGKRSAIALERIVEHLEPSGATRAEICAAIGELNPIAGSGEKIHVLIFSPERIDRDETAKRFVRDARKTAQNDNWVKFMIAANRFNDELPEFNLPTETVN